MFQLAIRFAVAALVVFSASVHSAELEAPLGLQWGQTQKQVKAKGVTLYNCEKVQAGFTHCFAKNLPKPLSFADAYLLGFHPKLQYVLVGGKDIVDDPYGIKGKKQFADLKQRLIAKYGKPDFSFEKVGAKLYDDSDEFYQCLSYTGCGGWYVSWKIGDASVVIEMQGASRGKGWIKLSYESKDFQRLLDEAKARQADTDDAGL